MAACNFIRERNPAPIFCAQANSVHGLSTTAALLAAGDRNYGIDFRDGETLRRPDTEDSCCGNDFPVANADPRRSENNVKTNQDH